MRLGLLISATIILVFIGVVLTINSAGDVSGPTKATRDDRLRQVEVPAEAYTLHTPANPDADATEVYEAAIRHFRRHEAGLKHQQRVGEPHEAVGELRELLIEAMDAGQVETGFLDRYLPLEPAAEPRFGEALRWIPRIMMDEAFRLSEIEDEPEAARQTLLAVWTLGARAFEHNVRLFNRRHGLDMMRTAATTLFDFSLADNEESRAVLRRWSAALGEIESIWGPKIGAMLSVDPHVGDLLHVVRYDQDRTFRLAATLRLGIARHTANRAADRKAAEQELNELQASDDPLIAEAAKAASEMTRERLRVLR